MPYRYAKKSFSRRKPYKSRSYKPRSVASGLYNYKFSVADVARQVWKLKGLVNSEMYKFDFAGQTYIPYSSGSVAPLTGVAQGDGDGNRTGNSIFARSLNVKGYVQHNTSGDAIQIVRVALVQDTQQIGDTAPVFSDIYEGTDVNSHLNSETVGRFKILYNQVLILDQVNAPLRKFEINKAMRQHIRFNGNGAGDVQKDGIYLVMVSSQGGAANGPTLKFDSRLSYHDN